MSTTSNFSISNQNEFEDALCWVSDLFKDVNGFRPRGYNFHEWSFQELTDFINDLSAISEKQAADERAWAQKAVADVMSVGADCKETALRWLDQADAYFMLVMTSSMPMILRNMDGFLRNSNYANK